MYDLLSSIFTFVSVDSKTFTSFLLGCIVASAFWTWRLNKFYVRKDTVTKDVRYHCSLLKQEGGNEWEDIVIADNELKFNPCRYFKKGKCIKLNSKCLALLKFK
ncbi:hypothetical protein [Campylobacter fetus]|uniref:hypothetical protein n=1 Tax=Campylobacter fetus TaxID=196 RepID=UPI000FCC13EF|nr:hypothetical protein [Campylobacter fetus]RUT51010.1 hypothetical protein BWK67_00360 [Campylobacter fetus]RUT51738.1 hypothetical protein BWK51_00360 [Campylobacter fetus]